MIETSKTIIDKDVLTKDPKYNEESSGLPFISTLEGSNVNYTMLPIIKRIETVIQCDATHTLVDPPYWLPYIIRHDLKKKCYVFGRYTTDNIYWTTIQNIGSYIGVLQLYEGVLVTNITDNTIELYIVTGVDPVPVTVELFFVDLSL